MGFKSSEQDITNALNNNDLSLLLRNFGSGNSLSKYLTVVKSPGTGDCLDRLEITLNAEYTTVASDTSDLDDVLKYLTNLIPQLVTGRPSPGVIVNGIKDGYETLKAIIETENVTGTPINLTFPIEACDRDPEVISATLSIEARGQVSNAKEDKSYDPNDFGQAFAKTHMVCNIGSDRRSDDRVVNKTDAEQGNIRTYSINNWAILRGRQTVGASVTPHCRVTDTINIWDEIAALSIPRMQLIIEVIPPELYRTKLHEKFLSYLRREGIEIPAASTKKEKKKQAKAEKKAGKKTKKKGA